MSAATSTSSGVTATAMRRRTAAAACAALVMGLAAFGAQAQPRDDRRRHPGERPAGPRPQPPRSPQPSRPPQAHRPPPGRGAGPERRWYQGDRVPPVYRTHHYVVNDWRAHRLSPPPRGYHWVQYGSDYLLVAIATGVILQLVLSQ